MKKRIVFTGGGSAGHVTVNLALMPHFQEAGWEVAYIGSTNGIEKELVGGLAGVRYVGISSGKLRRYFDWKNVTDPFRVTKGIWQAFCFLRAWQPDIIFSKGGFVSVPVVLGGWMNRLPVVIHESDLTPGLANRLSVPFASKVCVTFPETVHHLPASKGVYVGAVIRSELLNGSRERGISQCGFTPRKPVLLVMGGSLGARRINEVVRSQLQALLTDYQVVHICGKGQGDESLQQAGYRQYEYVTDELPDLLTMADLVVSRAGSNAIFECLALRKPMLLIPLSKTASRGDQILNARSFEKRGFCEVLLEEDLSDTTFLQALKKLGENRSDLLRRMKEDTQADALTQVISLLKNTAS
ncbi:undecaprenyldiphospho-muramoylpentapeptide beta-N-acetylglucosaminyltransferase [Brevibacillus choshinensis]|uniref:undecaprenyldiphospho-muramoylpentapeptide beta-N-acetylglucosaminyltransferase n=2 Tax=Brevibacillus choshinensis TaxID=54911 RepID=UPI002E1E26EC|nr:undecaprenyldiphospho-muramoylpentapeptide beta-N-acetylglucosaminyltransferase [Brevibacillus choshinensis]